MHIDSGLEGTPASLSLQHRVCLGFYSSLKCEYVTLYDVFATNVCLIYFFSAGKCQQTVLINNAEALTQSHQIPTV